MLPHAGSTSTLMNVIANPQKSSARLGQSRSNAPVFVLGCPRSGTTLLYNMLLSSGHFAVYDEESNVFNNLMPRFGNLRSSQNRLKLLKLWYTTILFKKTGLGRMQIEQRILDECQTAGDFLRIFMEEITRSQGVERWAETTNEHLVILPVLTAMIPEALIIHMIRDGRAAALSLDKGQWLRRYPWSVERSLMVHALYWEWMVRQGREGGRHLGPDYLEVRFENLVARPRETLDEVGRFIKQDLDYDQIRAAGMRTVINVPNTSFKSELSQPGFDPVGRWKKACSPDQLAMLESLIGKTLTELGYSLGSPAVNPSQNLKAQQMHFLYPRVFSFKKWVKYNTPWYRLVRAFPEELLDKERV